MNSDAYRCPPPSGPTPRRSIDAARARRIWRAFWRHRGEEVSALAGWWDDHPGVLAIAGLCLAAGLIIWAAWDNRRDCRELCSDMGARGDAYRHACYCVDDSGRPWRWDAWPGVDVKTSGATVGNAGHSASALAKMAARALAWEAIRLKNYSRMMREGDIQPSTSLGARQP